MMLALRDLLFGIDRVDKQGFAPIPLLQCCKYDLQSVRDFCS